MCAKALEIVARACVGALDMAYCSDTQRSKLESKYLFYIICLRHNDLPRVGLLNFASLSYVYIVCYVLYIISEIGE